MYISAFLLTFLAKLLLQRNMTTWDQPIWVKSRVLQLAFLTYIQPGGLIGLGKLARYL